MSHIRYSLLNLIIKTVLAAGVFDYFHPGHRFFLQSAKKLGDNLVIIIARDANVIRLKNLTPVHSEVERMKHIQQSQIADTVLLGKSGENFLKIVSEVQPDILALGYDQSAPKKFTETFPEIKIVTLTAKNPDQWKSSKYRERGYKE